MFAALKSLLSVHVAPGGSHVNVAPFSFAWGAKINVRAVAGDDEVERAELLERLKSVEQMLDRDDLAGGRDLLRLTIEGMVKE